MKPFRVFIENFLGGYLRRYWASSFPVYGNRNQAARMRNIDLRNPNVIQPGPDTATLTNGNQAGVVKSLLRGIMKQSVSDDVSFGVGGTAMYKIQSASVTSDANFPHTIGGAEAKTGEDVKEYHDEIYYTFNHAATSGEMGKLTLPNTFDDDFLSTAPTVGAFSLQVDVPHPLEVGGDDVLYIGNGHYVSSYDKTTDTADEDAIDLPDDCVVTDIKWNMKKLYITVNWPNLTGNNQVKQSLFIWNTVDDSWDDEIPQIKRGGGMFNKEGVLFIFYEDITSAGEGRLGYFDGARIKEVCQFDGGLPAYYQIIDYDGFITWVSKVGSEDLIFCWGAGDDTLTTRVFQFMKGEHANIGGITSVFGDIIISSYSGTDYDVGKESGYQTDSYWKGMTFLTALDEKDAVHRKVIINNEVIVAGTAIRIALRNSKDTEFWMGSASYSVDGAITKKIFRFTKTGNEDTRLELDWSIGSSTNPYSVRNVLIDGHSKE